MFVIRGHGERVERKREDGKGEEGESGADVAARCGCSCRAAPLGGAATLVLRSRNADGRGRQACRQTVGFFPEGPSGKTELELIPVSRPELFCLSFVSLQADLFFSAQKGNNTRAGI